MVAALAVSLPAVVVAGIVAGVQPRAAVAALGLLGAASLAGLAGATATARALVARHNLRTARLDEQTAVDNQATAAMNRERAELELRDARRRLSSEDEEPPPPPALVA